MKLPILNVPLIKQAIVKFGAGVIREAQRNAPTILTVTACVGTVSAVVYTAKVAPEGARIIQEAKDAFVEINEADISEEGKKKQKKDVIEDTAKDLVPIVVPPVMVTGMALACIIGAHKVHLRRQMVLATACDLATKSLDEYQAKVKEYIGERKEKEQIRDKIAQDIVNNNPAVEILSTGNGNQLFKDKKSGQEFRSSGEYVRKCETRIKELQASGYFTELNQFYSMLGINHTDFGEIWGFPENLNPNGFAKIDFDVTMKGDEPCIVLDYSVVPNPDSWVLDHILEPI